MKFLFLLTSLCFLTSCQNEIKKEELNIPPTEHSNEYSVLNQIFSKIGDPSVSLFNYSIPFSLPDSLDKKIFEENFSHKERLLIFQKLKEKNIAASSLNLSHIKVQLVKDSLFSFKMLKAVPIDLKKLNTPPNVILISKNDSLYSKEKMNVNWFAVSRVFFNKKRTKAEFKYEFMGGYLHGRGIKVSAQYKNGSWVVTKREMIWVS